MEKMLGVMLDCSRNAVMKVDAVKQYADIIRKMGYNTLMLYTEDTYEVDGQPYFGHLRGRYSKEELKEIDAYCQNIGIELIPCIQTLAHLDAIFKWQKQYFEVNDCDNILLIGEEKTYELIDNMLSTLSQCFSSRKIHIGMDEAYRVGTGKYKQLNGERDRFDIINEHLHRVCDIAEKYGFEPMVWSDMFYKLALNIEDQYLEADTSKILEKANLPEKVSMVYWDYYGTDYERYEKRIKANKLFGRKTYFAGGAWTWKGLVPDNKFSMKTTEIALKACDDCGIDGVLFTIWGDDGSECPYFAVLPSLMYAAEILKGNNNIESIKSKFKQITGCEYDSFMLFDKLDIHEDDKNYDSSSKCILYNDLFLGMRNSYGEKADSVYYKNISNKIRNVTEKGEFKYLFDFYEKFADVLSVKYNLSTRIVNAYQRKNMEEIKEIIADCDMLLDKLKEFHKLYQKSWFEENKPHGFDIQDIRLGGLMQRIASCKDRLMQFASGEIDVIEELCEPVLSEANGKGHWSRLVTPNIISHSY